MFDFTGIADDLRPAKKIDVVATSDEGKQIRFTLLCRIDTPREVEYYKNDGILHYVLRSLMKT